MANTATKPNAEPKKDVRKMLPHQLKVDEFAAPRYRVIIEDLETNLDDINNVEFWAHVGKQLEATNNNPFPIVELIWADGTQYVRVMVIAARNGYAKVRVLEHHDWSDGGEAVLKEVQGEMNEPDDIVTVKWISPTYKYGVIRNSDKEYLHSGCDTKEEAQKWANQYLSAL